MKKTANIKMTLKYTIVLSLLLLNASSATTRNHKMKLEVWLPYPKHYNWHPAPLDSLECPSRTRFSEDTMPFTSVNMGYFLDETLESTEHLGYLCRSTTYVSTCETNFFGISKMSYRITENVPSINDCESGVLKHKQGLSSPNHFPPFECQWMASQEKSITETSITPHPVRFDIYANTFVDGLFISGSCLQSPCKTHSDSVVWIKEGKKKNCNLKDELVTIGYKKTNDSLKIEDHVMHSDSLGTELTLGACKEEVCGFVGIRFKSGAWVTFQHGLGEYSKLRHCESQTGVKYKNPYNKIKQWALTETEILMDLECRNAIETSKLTGKISPFILSLLAPDRAGYGKAYRINNGTLEMTTADYVSVNIEHNEHGISGIIKKEKIKYNWEDWVNSGVGDVYSGVNGLIKANGQIHYPILPILHLQNRDQLFKEFFMKEIPHLTIKEVVEKYQFADENVKSHYEGKSIWDGIKWPFGGITGSVIVYSLAGLVTLILLLLLIAKVKKLFRKREIYQAGEAIPLHDWTMPTVRV